MFSTDDDDENEFTEKHRFLQLRQKSSFCLRKTLVLKEHGKTPVMGKSTFSKGEVSSGRKVLFF